MASSEKLHNSIPIDISKYLKKLENENEEPEEFIYDIQKLLQSEADELNELNLREIDNQIIRKFHDCINSFVEIVSKDTLQNNFFTKIEHKQLNRLQQEPLKCQFRSSNIQDDEIKNKIIGYSSLITTYQIHCCYIYKLFNLNIKDEKKIDFLNLVYTDMENDTRLIYTGIYLANLLLSKNLARDDLHFPEFFDDPESNLYKKLVYKIISSSEDDMRNFRNIAKSSLEYLSATVNNDAFGIDPNPFNAPKLSVNKITAYQMNRNIIDKRMEKLLIVMINFITILKSFILNEKFSGVVYLIIKEFLSQCQAKFQINISHLDHSITVTHQIIHTVLSIIFLPLCAILENPVKEYVLVENFYTTASTNFKSLSDTVFAFFSGTKLGDSSDRWYSKINEFNVKEENILIKIDLMEKIMKDHKIELEEKYLEALFLHSLKPSDKKITVSAQKLVRLHSLSEKNLDLIRVNNPSFDPLAIVIRSLQKPPSPKTFNKNVFLNLVLYTRSLRYDQSIVRCPDCNMLIPRDMSPNNFKQVIEIYDPMPPDSPIAILAQILATGPKKQKKGKLAEYITGYQQNYYLYLKDYATFEKVKSLLNTIDTKISAELGLQTNSKTEKEVFHLEQAREKYLKTLENDCEAQYKRRKIHCIYQYKISNSLSNLEKILNENKENSVLSESTRTKLLFSVEYGACNIELETFSDSVYFSLFMNKIREYTSKKEMSLNLYENLTEEIKEALRGFMKRTLKELLRKGVIKEFYLADQYLAKNILLSFELESEDLIIIVTNSLGSSGFCKKREFGEEEVLMYEKIKAEYIMKMREEHKKHQKDFM